MEMTKRITLCRLIERMNRQKECCAKLGLENRTRFRGKPITYTAQDAEKIPRL